MELSPGVISPQDWGLPPASKDKTVIAPLAITAAELEARARAATYEWLRGQFDEAAGAFGAAYQAKESRRAAPAPAANLAASWQLMAAYDRYEDADLLEMARRALAWLRTHHTEAHPASLVAGGVRQAGRVDMRLTAEAVVAFVGLAARLDDMDWLERAVQSASCLLQARRHGFASGYAPGVGWQNRGESAPGRALEANLLLWQATQNAMWLEEAHRWGDHVQEIQAEDGALYLREGDYYSTRLAAHALRGLAMLFEATGEHRYLWLSTRFADWHIRTQSSGGAWPLTVDRDGHIVVLTVRPGDVAEIGTALLYLHHLTGDASYLKAMYRALRFALGAQAQTGAHGVRWGFWTWEPRYDHTLAPDHAARHTRAIWFALDYRHTFNGFTS